MKKIGEKNGNWKLLIMVKRKYPNTLEELEFSFSSCLNLNENQTYAQVNFNTLLFIYII